MKSSPNMTQRPEQCGLKIGSSGLNLSILPLNKKRNPEPDAYCGNEKWQKDDHKPYIMSDDK